MRTAAVIAAAWCGLAAAIGAPASWAGGSYDSLIAGTANLHAYYSLAADFTYVGPCPLSIGQCTYGSVITGTEAYGLAAAPNVTGTFVTGGYNQLSYTNLFCMLFVPSASASCPARYSSGTFALEVWIDGVGGTGQQAILAAYGSPGTGGSVPGLYVNDPGNIFAPGCATGKVSFWIYGASDNSDYTSIQLCSATSVNDGAPHHIVVLGDGANLSLVVDTVVQQTASIAGVTSHGTWQAGGSGGGSLGGFASPQLHGIYPNFNVGSGCVPPGGCSGGDWPLSGIVGGLAYYLAPLTPLEIVQHYDCGMLIGPICTTPPGAVGDDQGEIL